MEETWRSRVPGKTWSRILFGVLALLPLVTFPSPAMAATPSSRIDFDADVNSDLAVWRSSNGAWFVKPSSGSSPIVTQWGDDASGDIPVPGDYDGDGTTDLAVWRPSNGTWYVKPSSGAASMVVQWGDHPSGDIPVPGDYDGDGTTDLAVWRPSTGTWFVKPSSGAASMVVQWGDQPSGDIPVPGDFDGDGTTDLAVWRPSNGTWYVKPSSGIAAIVAQWGEQAAGDIPVPGDYDGDGKTDLAVWRPSNGTWHAKPSSGAPAAVVQWGDQAAGDKPVIGDFDGDGNADFAVWRSSNGTWHVKPSSGVSPIVTQWGEQAAGDIPLGMPLSAMNLKTGGSVQGRPVPLPDNVAWIAVSTFAGNGDQAFLDCTVGTGASFNFPKGAATDGANLYLTDSQNHSIRKVAIATGEVTTVAGDYASPGYADGTGTAARFSDPGGITTDGKGNLYVADSNNHLVRKIVIATGAVTTIAGDNVSGTWNPGYSDGTGPAAKFAYPNGITFDGKDLYVADGDNHVIRKVVIATGEVTTIAGDRDGSNQDIIDHGYAYADNDNGLMAKFAFPSGITSDGTNLYLADTDNHLIRKIVAAPPYNVTTIAGDNAIIPPIGDPPAPLRDGIGTAATFASPDGVTTDGTNLWIADTLHNVIRKIVVATRMVTTIAGDSTVDPPDFADGMGLSAHFDSPFGITTDGRSLYVCDMRNNRARKIR